MAAIVLDGSPLSLPRMLALTAAGEITLDPDALARVVAAESTMDEIATRQPVYGRTTGVGANKDVANASARALLRSHAIWSGPPLPEPAVRLGLAIRINQLLRGGSGASVGLVHALADLAGEPAPWLPVLCRDGSLGTGDLAQLAQVGLTLVGERHTAAGVWRGARDLPAGDGLPLLSSSAFTIARAAIALGRAQAVTAAAELVAALTVTGLGASDQPFSEAIEEAALGPGAVAVARRLSDLVPGRVGHGGAVQDAFAVRTVPAVHGASLDAIQAATAIVQALSGASAENPRLVGDRVAHHGAFHTARLALALETVTASLGGVARLVAARVGHAVTDDIVPGAPRFLAELPGESGLMMVEYVAVDQAARIRMAAAARPSVYGATASAGVEDDAPLTAHAVLALEDASEALHDLVAAEMLCGAWLLARTGRQAAPPVQAIVDELAQAGRPGPDRDLSPDLERCRGVVDALARAHLDQMA